MDSSWYLDDEFWRTFGPLMFGEAQFNEAARQIEAMRDRLGPTGVRVLDLGCGPGRHALPLARSGFEVTAVDTSAVLLAELERRANEEQLGIECVQADMREFLRPEGFDTVLVMWTSFGYFVDEADHARVLANIAANLAPGGLLLLDLLGLETLCRTLEPVHLTEYEDGRLLIERPVLTDYATRLENEWLLIDGEQVRRAMFSHRVWSASEIRRLVEDTGMTVERMDADLEGNPYGFEAERLLVQARKPRRATESKQGGVGL